MALIDTGRGPNYISNKAELVTCVRYRLMEELDAANSYDQLIQTIKTMAVSAVDSEGNPRNIPKEQVSFEDAKELVSFIGKIRDDEIRHSGALVDFMKRLDAGVNSNMSKGIEAV
jgi:hypothetical protein